MQKTVTVTFDDATSTLTLDPSTTLIELGPGDWVEWDFQGVPAGVLPAIHFASALGPFQCLQSMPQDKVQGKGNVGSTSKSGDSYSYTAWLLDDSESGSGVRATSGQGVVVNLEQSANTSPTVVAHVAGNQLNLDPPDQPLMLSPGDTALWNVFDLSPGNFITLLFHPALETDDPMVGPFQSILFNRAVEGEETDVVRVTGVNFTPDDRASYSYRIAVRDSAGTILVFHDPTIDNLGPPPVPPPVYAAKG